MNAGLGRSPDSDGGIEKIGTQSDIAQYGSCTVFPPLVCPFFMPLPLVVLNSPRFFFCFFCIARGSQAFVPFAFEVLLLFPCLTGGVVFPA